MDAERSPSGVAYLWLQRGDGLAAVRAWDRVGIEYTGWNAAGEMFESSRKLGGAAMFDVSEVIPGWSEALQRMKVGDHVRLWIPAEMAHNGRPRGPEGPLLYDLALSSVQHRPEPPRAPSDVALPMSAAIPALTAGAPMTLEAFETAILNQLDHDTHR